MNTLSVEHKDFSVSPSEQVIVISVSQLQDLLKEAVREAIQPLQAEVSELQATVASQQEELADLRAKIASLEATQEQDLNHIFKHIAQDRQRIYALEHSHNDPGKTELSRAEKIAKYLAARPDHRATFETLKGHLGIGNDLLNKAVRALPPERFRVIGDPRDKRKRILVLLPK